MKINQSIIMNSLLDQHYRINLRYIFDYPVSLSLEKKKANPHFFIIIIFNVISPTCIILENRWDIGILWIFSIFINNAQCRLQEEIKHISRIAVIFLTLPVYPSPVRKREKKPDQR